MAPKIVPYVLLFTRRRLPQAEVLRHPEVRLQTAQINRFAITEQLECSKPFIDQTTNRQTRFWLRPKFRLATELARSNQGSVAVGDIVDLLKGTQTRLLAQYWQSVRLKNPRLFSCTHFEALGRAVRIKADLDKMVLKRKQRKPRTWSGDIANPAGNAPNARATGARNASDEFARILMPVLRDILEVSPDAGPALVARTLNEKGVSSARGGQWHASSASNLLIRCRRLRLLE